MADRLESLVFDLLVRDRASAGLSGIGRAAEGAAKDTDALTQRLNELSRKSATARVELKGDKEAQAALDKFDARLIGLDRRVASPNLRIEGVARAIAEISAIDLQLDHLGGKGGTAEAATSALGAGGLSGPGGMGALIGAGVALSPVIATLGVGLGGLGLAALSVSKNSKLMGTELAPLKSEFAGFSRSLQPEVLAAFGDGIAIARHGLHDIQPVAAATGKALDGVLGQIDAEFQSGTWQQFFGFMARTAGPDMQLLGNLFVDLAADIPPLLTQLQPLATGFLKDADAVLKLVGATTQAVAWEHQHAAAVSGSTGWLGRFGHAAGQAFGQMFPGVKAAKALQDQLGKTGGTTAGTAGQVQHLGDNAAASAVHVQSLAAQVTALMNAETKSLDTQLAYGNALVTQKDDAHALAVALAASGGKVGLQTVAQRASFRAAETYIANLEDTAKQAQASGRGINGQISAIASGLPMLERGAGHNKLLWQQIQILKGWLDKLRQEKDISEHVRIMGQGQWAFVQGGGQNARLHAARGLYIGSGRAGVDDQLVLAQRDELIVPPHLVRAGAVDHLRGMIPGFAQGGIVGSYSGALAGLQPWGQHNLNATITAITTAVARAMAQQMAAAAAGTAAGFTAPAGGGGGGPVRALMQQMAAARGWTGAQWNALNYVEMREAGYSLTARNPSSGAYGLAQFINGPSEYFQYGGSPFSAAGQITGFLNYVAQRYGTPAAAAAHEAAFNWYGSGLDAIVSRPTLLGVGERGPEHVQVTPGRGGGGGVNLYLTVNAPPGSNAQDIGRQLAGYLGAFIKSGGRLYPPGSTPRNPPCGATPRARGQGPRAAQSATARAGYPAAARMTTR